MVKLPKSNATDILRRRYLGAAPERSVSVTMERVNADVAQRIHDRRTAAGLTHEELAETANLTPAVIRRLESADFEGHPLAMLERIEAALARRSNR